jgi:RNA polymerase sigma-70 factor (ECF subfamily)
VALRGKEAERVLHEPPASAAGLEGELVARVQRGDTEAFDRLVSGYVRRARAIASRLMRDPDDADDLVQDAFLRALERIDGFDPSRAFGPWFFRLLVNTGLDTHRRQRLRRTEAERLDVASTDSRPDQDVERAEIRRRFEAALAELPPRQRLIVWAYEVDGMGAEQIAAMTGTSRATVRWHLHTARKALRASLADLKR